MIVYVAKVKPVTVYAYLDPCGYLVWNQNKDKYLFTPVYDSMGNRMLKDIWVEDV